MAMLAGAAGMDENPRLRSGARAAAAAGRCHRVPVLVVADGSEGDAARGDHIVGGANGLEQRFAIAIVPSARDTAPGAPDHLDAIPVVGRISPADGGEIGEAVIEVLLDDELVRVGCQHERKGASGSRAKAEVGAAVRLVHDLDPSGDRVALLDMLACAVGVK